MARMGDRRKTYGGITLIAKPRANIDGTPATVCDKYTCACYYARSREGCFGVPCRDGRNNPIMWKYQRISPNGGDI